MACIGMYLHRQMTVKIIAKFGEIKMITYKQTKCGNILVTEFQCYEKFGGVVCNNKSRQCHIHNAHHSSVFHP